MKSASRCSASFSTSLSTSFRPRPITQRRGLSFPLASRCVPRASAEVTESASDKSTAEKANLQKLLNKPYKWGFKTFIESETFPKGLSEDVVRAISVKKEEPEWMTEFRLKAYKRWLTMAEPDWSDNTYPSINYQDLSYYSEPKQKEKKQSLDEVDPELLATFDKSHHRCVT